MPAIRYCRPGDLDDLYRIAIATAARGCDASADFQDPRLVGHAFAAPYALFCPESVFLVEDGEGVGGYIVGTANTVNFEARLAAEWWPRLRANYADPDPATRAKWRADQILSHRIHHPYRTPAVIADPYPAHFHINLLPRFRGRGVGRCLMTRWLDTVAALAATGAHLSTGTANHRAVRFYRSVGFSKLNFAAGIPGAIWFGIDLRSR